MAYRIRELARRDLDAVTRVIAACDDDDATPARRDLHEYLKDGGRCRATGNFVACDEHDRPVGLLGYLVDREDEPGCDVYWGTWFYVDPRLHGAGVGSLMWAFLRAHLVELGCRKLYANVSSDPTYDRARRFYRRSGFELEHVHPDYFRPGEHSEIWGLRLRDLEYNTHMEATGDRSGREEEIDHPAIDLLTLQVIEAKPKHERLITRLFERYGRRHTVRARAYVWKHFHRENDTTHKLYLAGMRGRGLLAVCALEPAEEEEVDREVFWIPHLAARGAWCDAALGPLLDRVEERLLARNARVLYTSLPSGPQYASLERALAQAGFQYEGALPDYYADGVSRRFFVKSLRATEPVSDPTPEVERS